MPHTPGPWINYEDIGATYDTNGNVIMTAGTGCPGSKGEEGRANARLIAAAPELLEALVAVTHCTVVTDAINGQKIMFTHQALIDMINAAIAKATSGADTDTPPKPNL